MEMKWLKEKGLGFTIKDKEINGITGTHKEEVVSQVNLKKKEKAKVFINKEVISSKERNHWKKCIYVIEEDMSLLEYQQKVYERMYLEIQRRRLTLKDPKKKILDSLAIVDLDMDVLTKNINDLSSSERKRLQIGMALMNNPELMILIEPFQKLDKNNERKIMLFLQKIIELYDKTIVIVSDNPDKLYQYTSHMIIEKNHEILIEGKTKEIYSKVDFLKKNRIAIPEIVEFTYLAQKKKKAKIEFHRDIRDLIKDIYKHV